MKKTVNLIYYIIFVAALWLLNRHFQAFVAINGILQGLLVALILAFLAKLIFKTLTRVALALIIIVGLIIFLFSIDFFTLPPWFDQVVRMLLHFRG